MANNADGSASGIFVASSSRGMNSKEPVDGNSQAKFCEMKNLLRPLGTSIYDGSM